MSAPVLFTVHDAAGRVLCVVDHIERALPLSRSMSDAVDVRRLSDGAIVSLVQRLTVPHVYAGLWRMQREPSRA